MKSTLSQLIDHSRDFHGDSIAVEDPRNDASLTFRELGVQSDRVADMLLGAGIKRGDRVAIWSPKSVSVVAAIHGVLATGAAYVPLDAFAPVERNAAIIEDCGVGAIIVAGSHESALREKVPALHPGNQSAVGDLRMIMRRDYPGSDPVSDLAYILYTSGSTGRPKGVMHTHSSALSFLDWCSRAFEPSSDDRFGSHAPFHFDLSILDLFLSAKHGARVVLVDETTGREPLGLAALIASRGITVWYSTPSTLRLLTRYGRLARHDFSSLRLVLFAGEVFPAAALRALRSHWKAPRYFNLYGPTETNVCTWFEVPRVIEESRVDPFPIGRVCDNDDAYVTDAGELCISGGSVMAGYWNLPRLTEQCFIVDDSGRRWYRTGDIVRACADGYLFVGRRDRMVKRRGYRIELGEIESALARHGDISEAVVTAVPDDENGVMLHATVVADGNPLSIIELKRYCRENLPSYMTPDRFRFVDSIPQTSTGKTDYRQVEEFHS